MTIDILVAYHHTLCRRGMSALIEKETDFRVVAEVGSGTTAIEALGRETVDVLLLEATLANPPAPRVAATALQRWPRLAVVVLTAVEDEPHLQEFLRIGVHGFVLKKSNVDDLLHAIRSAHRGESYIAPTLAGRMVWRRSGKLEKKSGNNGPLTPREREVCRLVAYGHTNAEVASMLHISKRTVEAHRTHIAGKLNLRSRAELVRFAIDGGLLALE